MGEFYTGQCGGKQLMQQSITTDKQVVRIVARQDVTVCVGAEIKFEVLKRG